MIPRVVSGLIAGLLATLLLAACGGEEQAAAPPSLRVALDFTPNPVHAPLYTAVREGHDRKHGVRLEIQKPGSHPDSLKMLTSGRVDIGVLDIHDLAIARQRGVDVVGVGALVQRPLAAILAQPEIRRPRDLEGRRVGVSGLPSDPAFLRAMLRHDGGDLDEVRQVTIGFNAVSALLSRKVAGVPAFWNAEGVALRHRGKRIREFRVEDYGAPPYPEVVLMVTRETLRERRDTLERALAAIRDGVRSTLADPEPAVREIARAAGGADLSLTRAQMRAVAPLMRPALRLDRDVLERWADFDERIGLVERRPDVGRAFAFGLVE